MQPNQLDVFCPFPYYTDTSQGEIMSVEEAGLLYWDLAFMVLVFFTALLCLFCFHTATKQEYRNTFLFQASVLCIVFVTCTVWQPLIQVYAWIYVGLWALDILFSYIEGALHHPQLQESQLESG